METVMEAPCAGTSTCSWSASPARNPEATTPLASNGTPSMVPLALSTVTVRGADVDVGSPGPPVPMRPGISSQPVVPSDAALNTRTPSLLPFANPCFISLLRAPRAAS
ncbi:MAG: hypothetical protein M5U28_37500 [Sandaracinaceae bacterium]|nr:hypothetical protein [Sandaracinaceae bacterium]